MKYLLDTDVIINHLRGKEAISSEILTKGCAISIMTKAELLYGAYKSANPARSLDIIQNLLVDLSIQIIDLGQNTILDHYAKIKVALEQKGSRLDEFDLLIASTATSFGLTLVTKNIRHFKRIKSLAIQVTN